MLTRRGLVSMPGQVLGPEYALVTVVSMREIRLVLMVHAALMRDISNVETGHKATGLGNAAWSKCPSW